MTCYICKITKDKTSEWNPRCSEALTGGNNKYGATSAKTRREKIQRIQAILDRRSYKYNGRKYYKGERVLFKEADNRRWYGPGKVKGISGNRVKIKHINWERLIPMNMVMPYMDNSEETEHRMIRE